MMQFAKECIKNEKVDIILCSTWKLFPLNIACRIAKSYKIPWIADLRDIEEQYPVKDFYLLEIHNKICIRRRNILLKKACAVNVVSRKHKEMLSCYGINSNVIYNGFDPDLFKISSFHKLEKFKIIYTGMFSDYKASQDISPLFSAISQLFNNEDIDYQNCRIQFFADLNSREIANNLAKKYNIINFIDTFEYISYTEIPKVLNDASILILLVPRRNMGIMTTKLYEYLGVGRPILCIWNDEGEIEEIINKSGAGIAAKSEEEIKSFIKIKYDEWLKTGYTDSCVNRDYVMQFSRKKQAKQFIDLFESIKI